jgi:diguanylate cyclase (GGDEF)-like protein/PAS domain S-box-containing protein
VNSSVIHGTFDNRRRDIPTRDAIDAIQELLFDPDASAKIFELVLGSFIELTNSEFGVCYVSGDNAEAPILPKANLTPLYHDNKTEFVNIETLQSWIGRPSLLNRPVFFNHPIPDGPKKLLHSSVNASSLMILPIMMHHQLRAVCILANSHKEDTYSSYFLNKLKPLIGAIMCTLQSAESVRGNFLGLDKKIADNRFLSNLISSSPVGIIVVDSANKILLNNPVAQEMFFHKSPEMNVESNPSMKDIDIHRFIPEFDALFQWSNQQEQFGSKHEALGPTLWEEQRAIRHDGSDCIVNLTIFRHTHGTQRFKTLQIQDITANHKRAEEYKQASQQLNALTQLAPVAILHVNIDWTCIFANDKWFEFSGLDQDESSGQGWINAIHPDDVTDFLQALHVSLNEGNDYNQEVRLVSFLGATKWVDFSMRVLFSVDGEVEAFLGTCADVTERYINQEKLRHIAEYDALTGLANRVLFQDRLKQAFISSQRDHSLVSLFFLDLDGFKDVNDTLGHNVGDALLQKVSDRLVNTLRQIDTVARFGGDEFVVLLGKDNHLTDVLVVAQKLIDILSKPYLIDGHDIYITTSLGVAQGSYANTSPDILLKNADLALYSAKNEGKNKYKLFNEELELGTSQRVNLLKEMRTGLKDGRFCIHYQAIADSANSDVIGLECLIRFNSKHNGLIYPDRFIPLLEETGMIIEVGRWVIEEACRQLSEWQKANIFPTNGYLAFNVSAKQLLDNTFTAHILSCCERYQVAPKNLVMEMTESVIINKPEEVKVILKEIKAIGLGLALDDFGTGYSSLSYLQNYPFDILKIDKSFIDDLSDGSNDTKIVKAIIALATSLILKVVAEGVETKFARETVKKLGAGMFQGFYLSRPIPAEDVPKLLEGQLKLK